MSLQKLFEAEKGISVPVAWTAPDQEDGYIRFSVPLEIEGVIETGLSLSGGAYIDFPDRHVTLS